MPQNSYGKIVLHCVQILRFLYLFICWWTYKLLLRFSYYPDSKPEKKVTTLILNPAKKDNCMLIALKNIATKILSMILANTR